MLPGTSQDTNKLTVGIALLPSKVRHRLPNMGFETEVISLNFSSLYDFKYGKVFPSFRRRSI